MAKFNLRLPNELYEWLKEQAEIEQRSTNAQVVWLIQQARTAQEARR